MAFVGVSNDECMGPGGVSWYIVDTLPNESVSKNIKASCDGTANFELQQSIQEDWTDSFVDNEPITHAGSQSFIPTVKQGTVVYNIAWTRYDGWTDDLEKYPDCKMYDINDKSEMPTVILGKPAILIMDLMHKAGSDVCTDDAYFAPDLPIDIASKLNQAAGMVDRLGGGGTCIIPTAAANLFDEVRGWARTVTMGKDLIRLRTFDVVPASCPVYLF